MTCIETSPRRFSGLPRYRFDDLDLPIANRPLVRLLGLVGLEREQAGPGLLIPNCRSVHSIGMRFPLSIIFLDRQHRVIRRIGHFRPGRLCACVDASAVVELTTAGQA